MKAVTSRGRVLIVDDQREMAEMLAEGLSERGFRAISAGSARDASELLQTEPFDALVTDLRMQPIDGFALLALSRKLDATRPVIIMTAFSAIDSAMDAIRQGAYHYLAKPFKVEELAIFLERAIDERLVRREAVALRKALADQVGEPGLVGTSKAMRAVFETIERLADTLAPVLLTGETGTGKGLVAMALHQKSERAAGPFVTVNCAALPETLLESELFGHVKGAFTGASTNRLGLFCEADGGTLFLDEVGELALPLQAKLLHAIEHRRIRPVGGSKEREVDVRIVAATHSDLRERVREGSFREDLLYRLDVVAIELPPLRVRMDDLPALVDHFLAAARSRCPRSPVVRLSREAVSKLYEYRWPGNVRELAHTLERVVVLGRSEEAQVEDLPPQVRTSQPPAKPVFGTDVVPMREMQRRYAAWALEQTGGIRNRAADKLDIDIKTLARLLQDEPDKGS